MSTVKKASAWPADRAAFAAYWDAQVAALEVTERAVGLDSPELEPVRTAGRLALVLGQEGPGVRPETLALTDADVVIPMPEGVDSLNVAAAAAVALWELRAR